MPKFQAPRGTRDVYPADAVVRRWILESWRRVSLRNGFEEYDGPTFEDLDLYRVKSGDEIVDQLFHFTSRGGSEYALRPEMTPTLARMVGARAQALPKPIKWFCMPAMFRAERPQRGRLREFLQWNIDILGEPDIIADAECIFVLTDLFRELGLTPDQVEVKINSRALMAAVLRQAGFADDGLEPVYAVLDKRDKLPDEDFEKAVGELASDGRQKTTLLAVGQARGGAGLASVRDHLGGEEEGLARHEDVVRLFAHLSAMGVADYCRFDMGVVRGLAYYTGVVFEAFGKGGLQRAVCGGGRYDHLLAGVGGPAMTGVGFGAGDVAMHDLAEEFNLLPDDLAARDSVFVLDAEASLFPLALKVASELRRRGFEAVFSYRRQSLGKQFKQASSKGAARAVIIDQRTADESVVGLKDLRSGVQKSLALESVLADPHQQLAPEP